MFDAENFEKVIRLKGSFKAKSKNSVDVDGHLISSHILVVKVNGYDEYYLTRYTEDDESGIRFCVDKYTYHIANGKIKLMPCVRDNSTDDYIPYFPGYFSDEGIKLMVAIATYLIYKTSTAPLFPHVTLI